MSDLFKKKRDMRSTTKETTNWEEFDRRYGEQISTYENTIKDIKSFFKFKLLKIKKEIEQLPDTYEDEESKVFKTTKKEILAILNNHTKQ